MDMLNASLSFVTCVVFVLETYTLDPNTELEGRVENFLVLEYVISSYFLFDFMLRIILSDTPHTKVVEPLMLVDFMTTIPVFLNTGSHDLGGVTQLTSVLRVFRIARMHHLEAYIDNEIYRATFRVVFFIVLFIFATASLVQFFENDWSCSQYIELVLEADGEEGACQEVGEVYGSGAKEVCLGNPEEGLEEGLPTRFEIKCGIDGVRYNFHDMLYFTVVTITTVGFGDISPASPYGRIIVCCLIMGAVIVLPWLTSDLVEAMNTKSAYQRAIYAGKNGREHVLVIGSIHEKGIRTFFSEFYHEDNVLTEDPFQTVILSPFAPSEEMLTLLKSPLEYYLCFLQGHPMSDRDLRRGACESARACFILANKFSTHDEHEDAKTMVQALNIKRFVTMTQPTHKIQMFIQLLRPENKEHLTGTSTTDTAVVVAKSKRNTIASASGKGGGVKAKTKGIYKKQLYLDSSDFVEAIDETKLHLLAKGCLCPGLMTLISNLSSSGIEDLVDNENYSYSEARDVTAKGFDTEWEREYIQGSSKEIYVVPLSEEYEGLPFNDVSRIIFRVYGVMLIGLELNPLSCKTKITINPTNFTIPDVHRYHVHGISIASDKAQAILALSVNTGTGVITIFDEELGTARRQVTTTASTPAKRTIFTRKKTQVRASVLQKKSVAMKVHVKQGHQQQIDTASSSKASVETPEAAKKPRQNDDVFEDSGHQWKKLRASMCFPKSGEFAHAMGSLGKVYYLLPKPAQFEDVSLESIHEIESLSDNTDRVLVCGDLKNIQSFIMPLRGKNLSTVDLKPIIILSPNLKYLKSVWNRLAFFPMIYIIQGSPLENADLLRSGADVGESAVILAQSKIAFDRSQLEDAVLLDADTIFTYQGLVSMNSNVNVQVELITRQNLTFLNCRVAKSKIDPAAAAGMAFTSAITDRLLAKSFFDSRTTRVLSQLIVGEDVSNLHAFNRNTDKHGLEVPPDSQFFLISCPNKFYGKNFGKIYDEFLKLGILTLAIRRGVWVKLGSGPNGNSFPYVSTNPDEHTRVDKCDSLYVLSSHKSNQEVSDFVLDHFAKIVAVAANAAKRHHTQMLGARQNSLPLYALNHTRKSTTTSNPSSIEMERRLTKKLEDFQGEMRAQILDMASMLGKPPTDRNSFRTRSEHDLDGPQKKSNQNLSVEMISPAASVGSESPPALNHGSDRQTEGGGFSLANAGATAAHAANKGSRKRSALTTHKVEM
jgi:hypothetical protein